MTLPAAASRGVSRRAVVLGALWSAPVIAGVTAAPAHAASSASPHMLTVYYFSLYQATSAATTLTFSTQVAAAWQTNAGYSLTVVLAVALRRTSDNVVVHNWTSGEPFVLSQNDNRQFTVSLTGLERSTPYQAELTAAFVDNASRTGTQLSYQGSATPVVLASATTGTW